MNRSAFCTALVASALVLVGCTTTEKSATNPRHVGPAVGGALGSVAGTVAGNVAGAAVAAGQGAANGAAAPFRNERRIIRTWRTETTSDGRTIKVPVDTEVDENGRPIAATNTR